MTSPASSELQSSLLNRFSDKSRPIVCIQGLGYVGAAMAIAVAQAKHQNGRFIFNVIGVDIDSPEGSQRIRAIEEGEIFFESNDEKLKRALREAKDKRNLIATSNSEAYSLASIIIVDVAFDVDFEQDQKPRLKINNFLAAIETIGLNAPPGALIIIETTVPPGTCEKIVVPKLNECLKQRHLPEQSFLVAHSYERVMPGSEYLDSIINFWRVYAGFTSEAAESCENFLNAIINTKQYPLMRLSSMTASETAKVLENSYRAATIAFMEEWGRFAEEIGIDLFEIIEAIRVRPTHSNIRRPGFGVGGYCLTKDPYLAWLSAKEIFGLDHLDFPFCRKTIELNRYMPIVTLNKIKTFFKGSIQQKKIMLLGISYRSDVGDTRYSPSEIFVCESQALGAEIVCHDPLISHWAELNINVSKQIPDPKSVDAIVFAVSHQEYRNLNFKLWLGMARPYIVDANNVLTEQQRADIKSIGCPFFSIGRGI